jgi:PAS domain S-box-containing protein
LKPNAKPKLEAANQQPEAAQRAASDSMRDALAAQEGLASSNRQLGREIAERKQAEAVLPEGEAQVRAMMNATMESIILMETDGKVVAANATAATRLGTTPEQLLGRNAYDLLPPNVSEHRRPLVAEVVRTGQSVRFEDERQGRWLDQQIYPVLGSDGRVARVVVFACDITERKRAEEAVRERERQLATLLRNLPGMAYRCRNDHDWTMSFVSRGCEELTGYAVEDLLNNHRVSYASLIMTEDQAPVWEEVQRAVREKRAFQLNYRIRTATGPEKWVWEQGAGVFAADGTLEALEGFIADVTERKQAEKKLRETNAYLENLINYANAPIIVWDPQFHITRFNHAFESLTGRTEADVLGQSLEILFPPAQCAASMALIRQTLSGERWEVVEIKIQHRDGSERTVLWNSATLFSPDGQTPLATIAQGQDITTRKSTEEALRESEWRFRDMMAKVQLISATLDIRGNITFANEYLLQLTGWRREEILGRNWFEVFVPPESKVRQVLLEGISEGSVPLNYENEILTRGGERRLIAWSNALLHDSQGGIAGVAGIGVDVTERKRAEAERERLAAKNLQLQKAESLGRMAGAIAHHFNNQLMAVMGNLEMALEDLPEDGRPADYLTAAIQSVHEASTVSSLMLTYLGQTMSQRELLDLAEACQLSLPLLRAALPKGRFLDAALPPPGTVIRSNAHQIQQVLTNLVTNAWEAMPDSGGTIRLTVRTVPAAMIPTANRFPTDWQPQDPAYACLEVADAGGGIPAEDIDKLCDPFFSRKFPGRGLGLAVALGLVRAHGGGITVESELGRGSVFRVFLPLSANAVRPPPAPVAPAPKAAGSGTVLVVEDDPAVRKAVTLAIKRSGFSVLSAEDGVEAVAIFRQHRDEVVCVLCDLTMPRMNGWETLAALRQLAPGIPVILASGYSEDQMLEGHQAEAELPQAFLCKPYKFAALNALIARILAGAPPSDFVPGGDLPADKAVCSPATITRPPRPTNQG